MIHRFARYHARRDAVAEVAAATEAFVDEVTRKEGGTAKYEAFQDTADPTRFTHLMAFRTPAAEKYHQTTPWAKTFAAKVHPLCERPPEVVDVKPLGKA